MSEIGSSSHKAKQSRVARVSEHTRRAARSVYTPIEDVERDLDAVLRERMAIQSKLQGCSVAASKREHRDYMLHNRGAAAWIRRREELGQQQRVLASQLKEVEKTQRFLKSKLKKLRGERNAAEQAEFKERRENRAAQISELVEAVSQLSRRVDQLEARESSSQSK